MQDVVVNGHVIAKAGDAASGIVLEAQQGNQGGMYGIGWKAANLRIDVETVQNFCGDSIPMNFIRSEYRRRQGIFGSHQDLEVVKGQKYLATVAHAENVCGEPTTATPLPAPPDALAPDDASHAPVSEVQSTPDVAPSVFPAQLASSVPTAPSPAPGPASVGAPREVFAEPRHNVHGLLDRALRR